MSKYTEITENEQTTIKRENADGSLTIIPMDEANSDFRAYLESLES